MKVKRTREMSQLEQAIIRMIFKDVEKTPDDGQWRKYEKQFTYEKEEYIVKCSFRIDNQFLSYKKLVITKPTKTILLN